MWRERITEMLENNPRTKEKFLRSVLRQIDAYGEKYFPTEAQLRLLKLFWESHQRRQVAEIIG
jgi:hypothetical protein